MSETMSTCDVFISFRGEDTRHTFTCHLYDALCRKGINTFMDDEELKRGDELGPKLLQAIQESRISVVVLSENYADSSWCLDELVKIHDCKKSKKQLVYPIFYKVEPSVVRHQGANYGEAMTKHELRFGKESEKVLKWRSALSDIANVKGDHLKVQQGTNESKFINDFARDIFNKVSPKDLSKNQHILGRERLVEELKSLLDLKSRHMTCQIGIHGMGGIGKTTLAKALYDSIYKQFEASSFLSDVRDNTSNRKGLEHLQQSLLKDILEDRKIILDSKEEGIRQIKSRFGSKRVLIVLDDVDDIEQMKNLVGVGDWFGYGSRIIITTRDKHLLDVGGVKKRYEVKELPYQECLELFCQNAFGKSCPEADYEVLSKRAVRCCKGLPLALKVLGSHMIGKDESGWKDALDKYEKSPHKDVQKVLRISYDSLDFNDKNIFLDIACLFKPYRLDYVKGVLDACDFSSGDGITTLINKSLLTVNDKDFVEMHDLIQDMGRAIVKEEAVNGVGDYSRLWNPKDVIEVLVDDKGSSKIQAIMLRPPFPGEDVDCIDTVFEKMKNLRILIVHRTRFLHEPRYLPNSLRVLEWSGYPSQSFPSDFYPRKIGVVSSLGSPLLLLLKRFQRFEHLTHMAISNCDMVTEFPDVSGAKKLKELKISGCNNLVSFHESVGHLANLVSLKVDNCNQLQSIVPTIYLPCLEFLFVYDCRKLAHFPEIKGLMDKPLKIIMSRTAIKDLPESINKLIGLNHLDLRSCKELQHLPSNLFMLPNFLTLRISECSKLGELFRRFERSQPACPKLETLHFANADLSDEDLQVIIYNFPNLKELDVSMNKFVSVPTSIIGSTKLASLDVTSCKNLKEIPKLPSSIQKIDATECYSLTSETTDLLWFQVRTTRFKRLQVRWPENEIPVWFDYVQEQGFPIFKARGKFPAVVLVCVFETLSLQAAFEIGGVAFEIGSVYGMHLKVENEQIGYLNFRSFVPKNQMLVLDLEAFLSSEDEVMGLGNDWKTIHIVCKSKVPIRSWGIYVHKSETNMDDIQFITG